MFYVIISISENLKMDVWSLEINLGKDVRRRVNIEFFFRDIIDFMWYWLFYMGSVLFRMIEVGSFVRDMVERDLGKGRKRGFLYYFVY